MVNLAISLLNSNPKCIQPVFKLMKNLLIPKFGAQLQKVLTKIIYGGNVKPKVWIRSSMAVLNFLCDDVITQNRLFRNDAGNLT